MKQTILLLLIGLCSIHASAQKTITGIVRDATDNLNTLPGVSIAVKGTGRGATTDMDGKYAITVQPGDKELVFSFIGMKTQTLSIGNKQEMNVVMESDANVLSEVVVSALGIKRENRSLTVAQQRVDAETMTEVRDQNIVSALAGKVAGVQVTPPSSSTGSARIVIRGNSSFTGNNQPLFVVDGMQIDNNDGSDGINKDGGRLDMGNGAADINPDDIESIDVLKGPNAAALYGSRAANGVIIITTKKAKDGRFKLSVNSNTMYRYISQWPDFQNSFGVGHMTQMIGGTRSALVTIDPNGNPYPYPGIPSMDAMMKQVAQAGGRSLGGPHLGQPYIGLDGNMYTYSPQPDNIYDFYQTAHTYTNNIALEGGNIDNNYRVSFTRVNANDVVEKQNVVNKNTLTLRFFNTLVKNLTLDSKVTFIRNDTKNRRYPNQDSYNPLYMYTIMPRTMTLDQLKYYKNPDGTEAGKLPNTHNPYWIINETANQDTQHRIMANFDLAYQVLPSLRLNAKYGHEYIEVKKFEYKNLGAMSDGQDRYGSFKEGNNRNNNQHFEWLAVYSERFDDFSVVGTLGTSRLEYRSSWDNREIKTLKQAGFAHISNSDDPQTTDSWNEWKRINSVYGSASLGFKDWAYLDVTARNDWSSTLPIANSSYFYPSFGISLIPTEIFKVPSSKFYGKLRASYAQVGNDTAPYRLRSYISLNSDNMYSGKKYASLSDELPNSYLKPERTKSYEIGTDLRFLNGRIHFDFTYYLANSFDQIVRAQMAASSGYNWRWYNAGEIRNSGIELATRFIPVENKNFAWEIDANFTKNKSEVISMVEGLDQIVLGDVFNTRNVIKVGYPYGALIGRGWLEDKQGRRLVNRNGGEPVPANDIYLGNANPDFLLGISNRFRYKNFDLYVLIDIKKGGKLFSGSRKQGIRNGVFAGYEQDNEDYWFRKTIMNDPGGENIWGGTYFDNIYYYDPAAYDENMNPIDPNYVPEKCEQLFWPGNVGYYADSYDNFTVYDASFVKLREIGIGYNFPKAWIAAAGMTNLRLSAVGRNLWTFYQKTPKGLDPESALSAGNAQGLESGALPPNTLFGFDIKITF